MGFNSGFKELISTQTYNLKACGRTTNNTFILPLVTKEEHILVVVKPKAAFFFATIFDGFNHFFTSSMNVSNETSKELL